MLLKRNGRAKDKKTNAPCPLFSQKQNTDLQRWELPRPLSTKENKRNVRFLQAQGWHWGNLHEYNLLTGLLLTFICYCRSPFVLSLPPKLLFLKTPYYLDLKATVPGTARFLGPSHVYIKNMYSKTFCFFFSC